MAVATQGGEGWSSRWAFVMAAVGSAVGLGNLVRFPAEAGANGGGAFVIFYIFCVALIGLPVLLSETLIGRHGKSSAIESVKRVAAESNASGWWSVAAGVGMVAAFLILTYYSVLAGWIVYFIGVFASDFAGAIGSGAPFAGALPDRTVEEVRGILPALQADSMTMLVMHAIFMAVTVFVVARGVLDGIEKIAVWLMPAFFVLLLSITVYGAFSGAFGAALEFLFAFDANRLLDPTVQLSALGQALFSLSLGSAMMITYGAYASRETNLAKTSGQIATADTSVAIIAGLAIFPIVFGAMAASDVSAVLSGEQQVQGGLGLLFINLPVAFQTMPAGSLIGLLFFIMVVFAALTSSVALLEASVSWAIRRFNLSRPVATLILGGTAYLIGAWASFSFNSQAEFTPLDFLIFSGQPVFGIIDELTAKIMLPVSALLVALFVGWIADKKLIDSENGLSGGLHLFWRFLVRWLCPLVIAAILLFGLFPGLLGN
ncbi:sodium-dependent transporter [Parasphingopyxis sp.]|uniref:sodium-dependent transporter n=1 Tax=Parasphingopyxis sp. TaxID=1920299 RepID=UPI00260B4D1F|nr:sodium-dependent transporter [Parasphingopyxis sp.]